MKLELDDGHVLVHSGLGDLTWGGDTYSGIGTLGSITGGLEDSELSRTPLTMTLSGISTELTSIVLGEHYQGRTATVYIGYLNLTTNVLADDPFIRYRGRIDSASLVGGKTRTITLTVESRFAAWDRPKVRRYNNADQQFRYPGDRGLEYIEQATEKTIVWGRPE